MESHKTQNRQKLACIMWSSKEVHDGIWTGNLTKNAYALTNHNNQPKRTIKQFSKGVKNTLKGIKKWCLIISWLSSKKRFTRVWRRDGCLIATTCTVLWAECQSGGWLKYELWQKLDIWQQTGSVQNVHMVLELQGHSRKYMFKNEENCKGTKIFFILTYQKLCSVIFLTAWCGIVIFLLSQRLPEMI